jgi:hypothetical protein
MQYVSLGILVVTMSILSYTMIFDHVKTNFPEVDRGQYIEGATAVWGAKELMQYAREQSIQKPVLILAEGNFGLVGDVLDVFLQEGDKIEVKGLWPLEEKHLYEYQPDLNKACICRIFTQEDFQKLAN